MVKAFNNNITLYHGSSEIVRHPRFGLGKPDNDYGSGFYLTENKDKANEWAFTTGNPDIAIRNEYSLNTTGLTILQLDDFGTLAWIADVAFNRGVESEIDAEFVDKFIDLYKVDTSGADVLVGYRADDSYTKIITAFFNNELTIDEVDRSFRKGSLGQQVFIKSEKAFEKLTFTGYEQLDPFLKVEAGESERIARKEVSGYYSQFKRCHKQIIPFISKTRDDFLQDQKTSKTLKNKTFSSENA